MTETPVLIHALSPLHAGTGQGVGVIDLPIARMKATEIPIVPGSSMKGVLREQRKPMDRRSDDGKKWLATFGPEKANAAEHAGAARFSDARLLALPVRSFKGTFAWVTSPLLLTLAKRDLAGVGAVLNVPAVSAVNAVTTCDYCVEGSKIYLQDLDLVVSDDKAMADWTNVLHRLVSPGADIFSKRLVLVHDDTMSFLAETCTQIDTRVSIDSTTGTAVDSALWTEESLPPETLLIALMMTEVSRAKDCTMSAEDVRDFAIPKEGLTLQFGGKATVGKGRCRVIRFDGVASHG